MSLLVLLQMQPPGWGPQGGVAHHRSAAGMHVAAHGAVPLCLRVQREVPHHHSQPRLLLPVWQLHWQQPAGEDGAGVRFTPAVTITFFYVFTAQTFSRASHCHRWVMSLGWCLSLVSCLLYVLTATRYLYRLHERTHSLWSYLWANRTDYTNPLYRPGRSQRQGALQPSTAPYCFK